MVSTRSACAEPLSERVWDVREPALHWGLWEVHGFVSPNRRISQWGRNQQGRPHVLCAWRRDVCNNRSGNHCKQCPEAGSKPTIRQAHARAHTF